jgi:2-methylcitrate dehydratase PrpD
MGGVKNMGTDADSVSKRIAAFIGEFDLAEAPAPLIGIAETAFVDTVGVMLAGSCEPVSDMVCNMIAAEGAAPAVSIVGRALRTSPQNAALANGTATQALDFDLSFMSGQSAAALIPALLPLAESLDATAEELMAAYIVGCEVCARIVRSFPNMSSGAGWHGAGVVGAMATAAAAAKLMRVSADRIPGILGVAASTASGLGENYGTMTKPLQVGTAARNGLMAAQLGDAGLSASDSAIDGGKGFLASYARGFEWDVASFDDLGRLFSLLDPGFKLKPFSCGGLLHTAIEAALHLRGAVQPRLDRIDSIVIGATRHAASRVKAHFPENEDAARFSLKFVIPYALIHGAPTLATFTDEALEDRQVRALSERVSAVVDDSFDDVSVSGHSPSRVTITFENGDVLEETVYHASGSREAPMSEDVIKAKFDDCTARAVDGAVASALYDYLRNLRDQDSLSGLWPLLSSD